MLWKLTNFNVARCFRVIYTNLMALFLKEANQEVIAESGKATSILYLPT